MSRTIVELTAEHLAACAAPCATCLFWELDPVRRARVGADAPTAKATWLEEVSREWGAPGRVLFVDDALVGYVAYAPPAYLPGSAALPTAPVSADAVLMTNLYLAPGWQGVGLGRVLVQAMAADLVRRGGIRAVEAFGDRRGSGRCLPPEGFLTAVGFRTQRAHTASPRMRMDLRTALTWRDEVGAAARRLAGAVRPATAPSRRPVPEATRTVLPGAGQAR